MNAPRNLVGTITGLRIMRSFWGRAALFGTLIVLCTALAFFPQRYHAAVTLTPTDPQSLGLSGTLGQLGAINSVFGGQAAVEVALRVGRSVYVRNIVIDKLKLEKRLGKSRLELHRWLSDKVDVGTLRGGIILVEMDDRDAPLARDVVGAVADATQQRLAQISRSQTGYKRKILVELVSDTAGDLAKAQTAYDEFRLKNRAPDPIVEVDVVSQRIPMLESAIKAKQIELQTARQLYTDNNVMIRQMQAQIAALNQQLASVRATDPNSDATVGRAIAQSSTLFRLERDLSIQRALYDNYLKFLQGTSVEDLTSSANVRILEPPFVDTERQYWLPAVIMGIIFLLLWGAVEFYRLRPPLGARIEPEGV